MHFCAGLPIILVGCKKDLRRDPRVIEELRKTSQRPVTPEEICAEVYGVESGLFRAPLPGSLHPFGTYLFYEIRGGEGVTLKAGVWARNGMIRSRSMCADVEDVDVRGSLFCRAYDALGSSIDAILLFRDANPRPLSQGLSAYGTQTRLELPLGSTSTATAGATYRVDSMYAGRIIAWIPCTLDALDPRSREQSYSAIMVPLLYIVLSLVAFSLAPLVHAAALLPRASGVTCTVRCQNSDSQGWTLEWGLYTSDVTCLYTDSGNAERSCYYTRATGEAIPGNARQCPESASTCPPQKREARSAFAAYQEQRELRAAQPVPTVPGYMKKRAALKKRSV
ncbi:hypothetical protein NMY22_g16302 [Coprinellus aureogranulatus]|nr:hypothetical protein NMY22_g16302 [Coprinellus aureogranulatus]